MGTEATVKASVCEIPYFKDDVLVISSDGLSDLVSPDEILEIVTTHRPEAACQALVDLANSRGGTDNITVIVIGINNTGNNSGRMKDLITRVTDNLFNIASKKKTKNVRG